MNDLLWVLFIYPIYALNLSIKEIPYIWKHPKLTWIRLQLYIYYFFAYPFFRHIYEKINTKHDIAELVYGETPLSTFEIILNYIPIEDDSVFVDLGCGKGDLVFYMNMVYGIKATGCDLIPTFIRRAKKMVKKYDLEKIHFNQKAIVDEEVHDATIVYLTPTCFSQETLTKITLHLETHLKPGTIVISISYPIKSPHFIRIKKLECPFSWSPATVYIQQKEEVAC